MQIYEAETQLRIFSSHFQNQATDLNMLIHTSVIQIMQLQQSNLKAKNVLKGANQAQSRLARLINQYILLVFLENERSQNHQHLLFDLWQMLLRQCLLKFHFPKHQIKKQRFEIVNHCCGLQEFHTIYYRCFLFSSNCILRFNLP